MLYELLKPRLPLLIYSLGISIAITLVRKRAVDVEATIRLALLICSTLSILGNYAPQVLESVKSGIGMNIGIRMTGGAESNLGYDKAL